MPARRRFRRLVRVAAPLGAAALASGGGTAGASYFEWPAQVLLPTNPTLVDVSEADASGTAAITNDEEDWYRFEVPKFGDYVISTATPGSNLDTVIGAYDGNGRRIAHSNDISPGTNTDSRMTLVSQVEGTTVWFGVTNFGDNIVGGVTSGSYTWTVDRPK